MYGSARIDFCSNQICATEAGHSGSNRHSVVRVVYDSPLNDGTEVELTR